jgi:transglutaminase-like putative cysteine protease
MLKKLLILISLVLALILISTTVLASNIYLYDSLDIELEVSGSMELIATDDNAELQEARAIILLYPQNYYQQELIKFESGGEVEDNTVIFEWNDGIIEKKDFSYEAQVRTNYQRNEVSEEISFPIDFSNEEIEIYQLEQYLEETETIDWSDSNVIAQANELAAGKDDLFEVVFNLASWVEQNIEYDINTLTAKSSQKSSWVLENKEGVCDEMTSLFIAMCRSLGIPARFVTGMTYSNSPLFSEPWQAHGWAEVYFPDYGWVSFDPTFGEYGYIDVTHVKLNDANDSSQASTLYEWVAYNVDISEGEQELDINTEIVDYGELISEEFSLEMDVLNENISFGSYNLITAIIKNENEFYAASTLSLAVPEEVEIVDEEKKTVLLTPKEVSEVYWIVKVSENLLNNYIYEFPYAVYTEKNVTVEDYFYALESAPSYSYDEISELVNIEEDYSYSRRVVLSCDYEEKINIDEETEITCSVKNSGNVQLEDLELCISDDCLNIDTLPISQEQSYTVRKTFSESGWHELLVNVNNDLIERNDYLNIKVLDEAQINFDYSVSENIQYGEDFMITFYLEPASFNIPKNLETKIILVKTENYWEIEELQQNEEIIFEVNSKYFTFENTFPIEISWEDEFGNEYILNENIYVEVSPTGLFNKMIMFFNKILF